MLAIIDGDVLAYKSCKSRWQDKVKRKDGFSIVSLDDNGKKELLEYSAEEDQKYMEECWKNFPKELNNLLDSVFATDYLMAMKGPSNFRDEMYSEYKANRRNSQPALKNFVPTVRQLAIMGGYSIEADHREADDYLRIWANEAIAAGQDYVICSIDKDLLCIPGKHYLIHKEQMITVTQADADRHYFQQLMKGDPTDNIPGLPGVGDVKALKMLSDCRTIEDYQEIVVASYIDAYGDDWESHLLSNGKMIHIQNHMNDWFTIKDWPLVQELRGL